MKDRVHLLAGIDIGGTKCAVSLGLARKDGIDILAKERFATPSSPELALLRFEETLKQLLQGLEGANGEGKPVLAGIGISCGGPLDSKKGLILSPPNLPGWDRIDVVGYFTERFEVPAGLQNDANACAVAEWKWGAGQGLDNVIFLTFGTGMGSGLILNGRLYSGTNDMAGEVGHLRIEDEGPIGYGKEGSFEGFCSGGGIAQLAQGKAIIAHVKGEHPAYCPQPSDLAAVTAERVGLAAQQGDPLAIEVFRLVGRKLGKGLSVLIDLLNPQLIIIGSIYGRQQALLDETLYDVLKAETLSHSLEVCRIVPAALGEQIGDYASLSVAAYQLEQQREGY
ncbi:ROK family protein [Paenibacillus nasutitermitis]|uniref:N-acylmannosamine kinase n=1 Tax=Paenibacillus nasutitermitis TaxID=1652958 RepID=A0A917DLQ0_9BACL|nr:ROK family protein [Paenibacillus nasutitermitis]GGD50447.1 N-acylmannosamine kinase [Paenibacillus nasutitermitis]